MHVNLYNNAIISVYATTIAIYSQCMTIANCYVCPEEAEKGQVVEMVAKLQLYKVSSNINIRSCMADESSLIYNIFFGLAPLLEIEHPLLSWLTLATIIM